MLMIFFIDFHKRKAITPPQQHVNTLLAVQKAKTGPYVCIMAHVLLLANWNRSKQDELVL